MGKVMVTGALGNVGGYIAKYLIQNGQDVVVADINMEAMQKRYGDSATPVLFDFTDKSTFVAALTDVDRVFIMRPPHLGKPEDLKPLAMPACVASPVPEYGSSSPRPDRAGAEQRCRLFHHRRAALAFPKTAFLLPALPRCS